MACISSRGTAWDKWCLRHEMTELVVVKNVIERVFAGEGVAESAC